MKRIIFAGIAALGLLAMTASAQSFGPFTNAFKATALVIATGGTTNINSVGVPLYKGRGIGVFVTQAAASTSTDNVTYNFQLGYRSADGSSTNWSTLPALAAVFALNNATTVIGYTNLPIAQIDNSALIRLSTIINGYAGNTTITSVTWSMFP
jgi:hypothetical protein